MIDQLLAVTPAVGPFSAIVLLVVVIALCSLLIRGRLPPAGPEKQKTEVRANLFDNKLQYITSGPVAELIALMATMAFVTVVFWLLLTRGN